MYKYQLLAAFAAVVSTVSSTLVAPDLSMRTIPVGYFGGKGGKSGPRDAASIAMLAKMRLVMLEKWEGPCWDDCVANATAKLPCSPSCNVEGDMLDVLKAVRAINPNVSTALYLNTLLLFPFYGLAQQYIDQGALLMDSRTNAPVELVNDDGMHGVYVPDFGTQQGRDLWLGTVKGWLASGLVDGIFADKWPDQAHGNKSNASEMVVCNHVCGHVSTAKGIAWNQGKLWVRGNVSAMLAVESRDASTFGGLLYGDGCDGCYRKSPRIDGNLVGPWVSRPSSSNSFSVPLPISLALLFLFQIKNWQFTPSTKKGDSPGQNVWKMVGQTRAMLHQYNYSYVYVGCGDHHPSDGKPFTHTCEDDLCTDCTPEGLAIYLLIAERGVILGSNGWSTAFEQPLGEPLGPALNVTNSSGAVIALTRTFASGTSVRYDLTCVNSPPKQEGYNCSSIVWGTWAQLAAWEQEQGAATVVVVE